MATPKKTPDPGVPRYTQWSEMRQELEDVIKNESRAIIDRMDSMRDDVHEVDRRVSEALESLTSEDSQDLAPPAQVAPAATAPSPTLEEHLEMIKLIMQLFGLGKAILPVIVNDDGSATLFNPEPYIRTLEDGTKDIQLGAKANLNPEATDEQREAYKAAVMRRAAAALDKSTSSSGRALADHIKFLRRVRDPAPLSQPAPTLQPAGQPEGFGQERTEPVQAVPMDDYKQTFGDPVYGT